MLTLNVFFKTLVLVIYFIKCVFQRYFILILSTLDLIIWFKFLGGWSLHVEPLVQYWLGYSHQPFRTLPFGQKWGLSGLASFRMNWKLLFSYFQDWFVIGCPICRQKWGCDKNGKGSKFWRDAEM